MEHIIIGFFLGTAIFFIGFLAGRKQGQLDEKIARLAGLGEHEPYSVGYERAKEKWRKIYEAHDAND